MADIFVKQIDITTLSVDAIVNAANNLLLGGGGVNGAMGVRLKANLTRLYIRQCNKKGRLYAALSM